MAENPIKASDLFEDDGVIRELIKQLQSMEKYMQNIGKAVTKSAKDIQQSTQKANVTQEEGRKVLQASAKEVKALAAAKERLEKSQGIVAKQLAEVQAQQQKNNQTARTAAQLSQMQTKHGKEQERQLANMRQLITEKNQASRIEAQIDRLKTQQGKEAAQQLQQLRYEQREMNIEAQANAQISRSQEGSYTQLSARYRLMKKELNEMSHEQRHNTEEGRAMERQARAIYAQMTRMQQATGQHQLKVGQYAEGIRNATMSMREMQQELQQLKAMPFEGLSQDEIKDVEIAIGELTDRMQKYRYEVEAHGMDTFEMISGSARGAAASVQLVAGSFNLLGIESKHLQTVQQNIYSMMAVTTALQQLEQVYHKGHVRVLATKIKGIVIWAKETAVKKYNAVQTWLNVRAQRAQAVATTQTTAAATGATVAKTAATGATVAWTVAVRAFSRAVYGIPVFGWLLAIIGAIVGVVVVLIRHWERVVNLFRSVGRMFGLVSKEAGGLQSELEKTTQTQRRLNLEMELATSAIERYEKAEKRRIELLKASGAATEDIEKAEKGLMEALLRNAKHRTEIARQQMLEQSRVLALMQEMNKSEEELAEQREKLQKAREHYSNMRESVEDIEHSLDVHHTNEQRRIRERMESEKAAAREKLISEKRATLELAVLRAEQARDDAKTDKDRERAALKYMNIRQQQVKELAAMELETVEDPKQRELIMERANREIRQIADDHYQWLYDREKERFDLLLELTQTEEQKRLTELRQVYEDRKALAGEDKELLLAIEQWYTDELIDIERKREEIRAEAERERRHAEMQAAEQALNDRLVLEESEFNVMARTQAEQQRFRLKQDLEYYTERLKLQQQYGELMTETEVAIVENLILETQRKIDEMGKDRPEDFWELVGIKMSDNTKELVRDSVQFALDNISMIIQARQQQADAAVRASEQEVDSARKAYEEELKLAKEGHANRLEIAERELEQAEKNKDRAADMAERERARQARLESLAQAGNLLVASTKIMAQYGIPMAFPFLAMMWSTFYAHRRRARQAAAETYGEGHFEMIRGGSHASGRDTPLNIDRRNRRVERGEAFAVFNRRATTHYGANNLQRLVDGMNRQNIDVQGFVTQNLSMTGNSELNIYGLQEGIDRLVQQGEEKTYIDNRGRLVKQRNNTTRIYV